MPNISNELMITGSAALLCGFSWWYAIWCHRLLELHKREFAAHCVKLEKQMSVVTTGSVGLGQRLMALERKLQTVERSQEDMRQSDTDFSYVQAQKLIEQGVDSDTIAANSGLSPSEVNLMLLMHQQNSAPAKY